MRIVLRSPNKHNTRRIVSNCRNLESLEQLSFQVCYNFPNKSFTLRFCPAERDKSSWSAVSAVSRGKKPGRRRCLQCQRWWFPNRQCRYCYCSSFIATEGSFAFRLQQQQQQTSATTVFLTGHVVAHVEEVATLTRST